LEAFGDLSPTNRPLRRIRAGRWLMAGVAALFGASWMALPVSADNDFLGVLKGSPPLSPPFVNSPSAINISSGLATVVFTSMVENKTDHVVTVTVELNVHHVMKYYGRDVSDGEPGKPGITFKPGDAPNTRQKTYGTPFERTITVQPKGSAPLAVSFSTRRRWRRWNRQRWHGWRARFDCDRRRGSRQHRPACRGRTGRNPHGPDRRPRASYQAALSRPLQRPGP